MAKSDDIVKKNIEAGRDPVTGHFLKGNKIRPYHPSGKKKDYSPILRAVAEDAYTPEQITDLLREMVEMARDAGDWKGIYAALSFILAYTVGKPVQRSITASIDADSLRAVLLGEEMQDDGGQLVEGSVGEISNYPGTEPGGGLDEGNA